MITYPHPPPPSHFSGGMEDDRTLLMKTSSKPIKDDKEASPPRPYTEYNIFFQLERERILCEIENERRENEGSRDIIIAEAACDVKKRSDVSALTPSSNNDNKIEESKYYTPSTSPDKVQSHDIIQSDPHDILPRPSRFKHLKLAPLWYNSSHRLAQSKLNKSRRRHRKTHGLIGFLELTKRIAKEWSQIDLETKAYCKRVADIQLKQYKDALMMAKKSQGIPVNNAGNNEVEQKAEVKSATYCPKVNKTVSPTTPAHIPTPTHTSSEMSCPGDSSLPVLHRGYGQQQKEYQEYQQHVPYPYSHHGQMIHGNFPRQTTYHKLPPSMPPLTPTSSEFVDEYNAGIYGEGEGHTALDELMYRRKHYGSQIAASQGPKRLTCTLHDVGDGRTGESNGGEANTECIDSTALYMSPNILEVSPNATKMSSMTITPSPSRRKEARQQNRLDNEEESTSSSPPMKKRLKVVRDESAGGIHIDPASATPGFASFTPGNTDNDLSPNFANCDTSPMYLLSPSAMITPGFKFGASPMSGGLCKELADKGMPSSPLPYIDWSPKDNSPQEVGDGNEYRMQHEQCHIPTHLVVPGQMHSDPFRNYNYPISHSCLLNEGELNDEQIHTNWHELESHVQHKMMRERHAAMTWMYNQYGHASGESGTSARDNMRMVHSFSTPMEKEVTYETTCLTVDISTNKEDIPSLESVV